jgi:NADP-dependent 3-hydroxy acid dehydrogenase YdfG
LLLLLALTQHRSAFIVSLEPLAEQVIVITGASSRIELVTARMAAKAGAKVVLAARNVEALNNSRC